MKVPIVTPLSVSLYVQPSLSLTLHHLLLLLLLSRTLNHFPDQVEAASAVTAAAA